MTRFARAQGSKASNEKKPEEGSSWPELKKMIVEAIGKGNNPADENVNSSKFETNYESESPVWADLKMWNEDVCKKKKRKHEEEVSDTKKAKKMKKITESPDDGNVILGEQLASLNVGDSVKSKKKKNKEILATKIEICKSKKKKKLKKIGTNSVENVKSKLKNKKVVVVNESNLIVKKKKRKLKDSEGKVIQAAEHKEKANQRLKKKLELLNSQNGGNELEGKSIKMKEVNGKAEGKSKKKKEENGKAEGKSKKKKEENGKAEGKSKKKMKENRKAEGKSKKKNEENVKVESKINKNVGEKNQKTFDKNKRESYQNFQGHNRFNNNYNNEMKFNRPIPQAREKGRRKAPLEVKTMFVNGQSVEVVPFRGFYILAEDAQRLEQLTNEMRQKGMSKKEIDLAVKAERRKAEKALARLRKKVCFHCRKADHNLSDCPEVGKQNTAVGICYKCGSTEHTYFECKVNHGQEFRFAECFICKEQGHIARQCPDNPRGLYPKGGACNSCGDVTHMKKDCPKFQQQKSEHSVAIGMVRNGADVEALEEDHSSYKKIPNKFKRKSVTF